MNKYDTMLTFYAQLSRFLESRKFHLHEAQYLVGLFEKFNEHKNRKFGVQQLREAHKIMRDENLYPENLVKWAFQDTAPYLRDSKAKLIADKFIQAAGMDDVTNLFVHVQNVRFPTAEKMEVGPAVVTLVVNRFDVFYRRWLQDPGDCPIEHIHASFANEAELIQEN